MAIVENDFVRRYFNHHRFSRCQIYLLAWFTDINGEFRKGGVANQAVNRRITIFIE